MGSGPKLLLGLIAGLSFPTLDTALSQTSYSPFSLSCEVTSAYTSGRIGEVRIFSFFPVSNTLFLFDQKITLKNVEFGKYKIVAPIYNGDISFDRISGEYRYFGSLAYNNEEGTCTPTKFIDPQSQKPKF